MSAGSHRIHEGAEGGSTKTPSYLKLNNEQHVFFMSFSPDNGQTSRFIHRQPGLDDERTLFMNSRNGVCCP
jgi:hypothetical protein